MLKHEEILKLAQGGLSRTGSASDLPSTLPGDVDTEAVARAHQLLRALVDKESPRILFVGGDDRLLQYDWPVGWRIEHQHTDSKSLRSTLQSGTLDLIVVLVKFCDRTTRRSVERYAKDPVFLWDMMPNRFCSLCNLMVGRSLSAVEPEMEWPPEILNAHTVKEVVRFLRRTYPNMPVEEDEKDSIIRLVKASKLACPALRKLKLEQIPDMVRSTIKELELAEQQKAEQESKAQAEAEQKKAERVKMKTVAQKAADDLVKQDAESIKKAEDIKNEIASAKQKDEFEIVSEAMVPDTQNSRTWEKEEFEALVMSWQNCNNDADIFIENCRTLGLNRSVSAIFFALQRALGVLKTGMPIEMHKRLQKLAQADRKKSTLTIVEVVHRPAGSTAIVDQEEKMSEAPTQEEKKKVPVLLRKTPVLEKEKDSSEPGDLTLAKIEYLVMGVRLGYHTKESAFDEIAKLVKR